MNPTRPVSQRVPHDASVCLTRVVGGGRMLGRSVDLGIEGIYVKCLEPCEIGTELICRLLLAGGPRKLRGRVIRLDALARGVGIAVAFLEVSHRDRGTIDQLITDHQRDQFAAELRGGLDRTLRPRSPFGARPVHLDATPAPRALPALCGHAGPMGMTAAALEREAMARAGLPSQPSLIRRFARRPSGTAEVACPPRFAAWMPPPTIAPAHVERPRPPRSPWRWPLFLLFVPVVAALALLLART